VDADGTLHEPLDFKDGVPYFPHGNEDTEAMRDIIAWTGIPRFLTGQLFRSLEQVMIPISRDGPLAEEFRDVKKKLQPLIFSHGNIVNRNSYSGLCREFASYGFLVISMNHNDGSCQFTTGRKVDGERERIRFDTSGVWTDYKLRHKQQLVRDREVIALIDEISSSNFTRDTFAGRFEKAKLDLDRIVVCG